MILRPLSRVAALTGVVLWLIPSLTAQSPAGTAPRRIVAIVHLKSSASTSSSTAALRAFEEDRDAIDGADRDDLRRLRDSRVAARIDALSRTGRQNVEHAIGAHGGRVVYSLRAIDTVVAEISEDQLAALRARSDVASVDIDEPRQAQIEIAAQSLLVPTFWNANYRGGSVDVAVIDTGLYAQHGAFASKASSIVSGVFHQSAQTMSNYWDVPTDPDDFAGHGTFVAGVVFSQGDTANPTRRGMAYGLDKFYNIKAGYLTYPSGGSSLLSDLMAGVDWALLSADPPEVFNYSYGARVTTDDDLYTQFWDGVVDTYAKTATISAGNSGPNSVGSPGMAYNILSVANVNNLNTATRFDDSISTSSSGGPTPGGRKKPDLAAPGTSLLMPSNFGPALWSRATGTSFSSPAVAGVAALLIDTGVSDPRAVKAVLINSADLAAGSAGWDSRWGWGYVNADRAFNQRGDVTLVSMTAPGGSTPVRFFERTATASTKATAVWHRHVSYHTGGSPTATALNNVDLRLYSRDTGDLRTTSTSTIDNVEQVSDSNVEGAVLTMTSATPFGGGSETVALAHSGGFVARSGPSVSVTLSANTNVTPASTFAVTGVVSNSGDMRSHGYEVTLSLPSGFTLVQGTLKRTLGSLDASGQSTVSWSVRAPAVSATSGSLSASALSTAYGFSWQASAQRTVSTTSGCGYSVTPTLLSLPSAASATTLSVAAPTGCSWTVTGIPAWMTMTPASGTGNGSITVTAPLNAGAGRTAPVTVAGNAVSVVQSGARTRTYYLAEGSTKSIFTLDIAISNPNDVTTNLRVTFLRPSASPIEQIRQLAPKSRLTIRVDDIAGLEATDVSTIVESLEGLPLAVERTMTWDGASYGGHGGTAVEATSRTWYFAEGSQGFFDTYVLLANPGSTDAVATITYLREGETPIVQTYSVKALSRTTVWAGTESELINRSFSMVVQSDVAIIAERAMYWSRPGVFWAGGHESAGVPEPATSWFLAEGATGQYFDEYVLVGNPNGSPVDISVRYLLSDGTTVDRVKTIGAQERLTINVETEDALLVNAAVSTTVTASLPVVVERAMYWPGDPSQWQEAHNAFGVTEVATRWALAEGRVGTSLGYETYILLANPSDTPASVRVTFLREQGAPVEKLMTIPPASRANVLVVSNQSVTDAPGLNNERFGALVEVLNGVGIAVERAMYWNSGEVVWAGGTNATAIKVD